VAILVVALVVLVATGLPSSLWRAFSTGAVKVEDPAPKEETRATPAPARSSVPSPRVANAAPARSSSSSMRFGIQVASFHTAARAQQALADLQKSSGLQGHVDEVPHEQGPWYRVVLGDFENPDDARIQAERLEKSGIVPSDRMVVAMENAAPAKHP
jgi:cell division protein FtsN